MADQEPTLMSQALNEIPIIDLAFSPSPEFAHLINLGKRVVDVSEAAGVEFVAYGSLAYLAHTQDEEYVVDDIDFLVSEEHFIQLMEALARADIEYTYSSQWHSIQILQDSAKIEIDATEFWRRELPNDFADFNINGTVIKIV